MCLDMWLGPGVWPELRKTILELRRIQPNVMLRNRGIGNYGDYYTPERVVPGSKAASDRPWFTIYPLGSDFSYDPDASKYKGTQWIIENLIDTVAKGGGFMIGVGPSAHGEFHPEALRQMKAAGVWLQCNGEAIYATRPEESADLSESQTVRYTRSKDMRFTYALVSRWPDTQLVLKSVRPIANSKVTLLGSNENLRWHFDSASGTVIDLPDALQQAGKRPCSWAWAFKMQVRET